MSASPKSVSTPKQQDLSGNKRKFQNGWTKEQEVLLAKWSDYASCYRWLHTRTETKLSYSNNLITIPVIILSTVTGSASVGLSGLVGDNAEAQKYSQISIGMVSLLVAIMTTLGNFFRFAQNSEAHRSAAIQWGKFNRMISAELSQKPDDRMDSLDFINLCKQDLDRLIEQSPQIPRESVKEFQAEFDSIVDLKKPDVCNNLEHTQVYNNDKTRLALISSEMALNMKHKKKVLRDELVPDLTKMINSTVDNKMRIIEEQIRIEYEKRKKLEEEQERRREEELLARKRVDFMADVRKKLSEFNETLSDFHITSSDETTQSNSSDKHENIIIDIIGQKKRSSSA